MKKETYADKVQKVLKKQGLTIEQTFVPRGKGNDPMGGTRDLHFETNT